MRANNNQCAGVLSGESAADSRDDARSAAYPVPIDCRQCSERTRADYTLCRDCLESLPEELCPSHVLGALVR